MFKPGPGAYNSKNFKHFWNIPILLKSWHEFLYEDDIKKKKSTLSIQRYKHNFNLVERKDLMESLWELEIDQKRT